MYKKSIVKQLDSIKGYCKEHYCENEVQALDEAIKVINKKSKVEILIAFIFTFIFWGGFFIIANIIY